MASSTIHDHPPYYVLLAHSQSINSPHQVSSSLAHPVIEYHYADDPPNSLLPQPGEHVLVLDYDPERPATPTVKSLSPDLVVSAVKVADAPRAAVAGEPVMRNNNIYVIETMTKPVDNPNVVQEDDEQSAHAVLARFKQRNALLRRILDYPTGNASIQEQQTSIASPSSTTPQS